jgi:LysR family pca operon transcriptional activator
MDFQNHLTIRHLRLLKVLGRELNMRRAAELLNTSQPAVSRRLAELESFLAEKLFERTTRKVVATALGRNLIWHAERILGDLEQAQGDFQALTRGSVGGLDIGLLRGFSPPILAGALTLMALRMPGIDIRFREGLAENQVNDLEQGRADVVLTHLDLPRLSKQIAADVLYEESVGLLVSSKDRLARRRRVTWEDVADRCWIVPRAGTTVRLAIGRALADRPGKVSPPPLVEITTPHFAVAIIRGQKNSVAAMPMKLAKWFDKDLGVASCLEMSDDLLRFSIYAARLRSRRVTEAANVFLSCLKESAGRHSESLHVVE